MTRFSETATATEVADHYASTIKDKVILTTGVSPGSLGAVYVETLATHSPKLLILAGRNETKLQQTADAIKAANPDTPVRLLLLDLADQAQVRKAAEEVLNYEEHIDVLMNNAAIMAAPYAVTKDGLEAQFGTNHIGHFLFTTLVLPKVLASPHPRIINVGSSGHRLSSIRFDDVGFSEGAKYDKWVAYGQAKTANLLFSVELAKRYGAQGLTTFSVHPGEIMTNLGASLEEEDLDVLLEMDRKMGNFEGKAPMIFQSLQQGTATHVFASFDNDIVDHNGAYLLKCRLAKPEEIRSKADDSEQAVELWNLSERLIRH